MRERGEKRERLSVCSYVYVLERELRMDDVNLKNWAKISIFKERVAIATV